MSDDHRAQRDERRAVRSAARADHVSFRFWTYLLALAAGFLVCFALYTGLIPGFQARFWGDLGAVFAMLAGILLMWLGEHSRSQA